MKVKWMDVAGRCVYLWQQYKAFIKHATARNAGGKAEDMKYWRARLFTKFITYLLPTCLIALVPGVFFAFKGGFYFIAVTDLFVVSSIAAVSLNVKLNLRFRKRFVIAVLYLLSIALLVDLSLFGPGMVYLLAMSVLVSVFFSRKWGYWSVGANILICIFCAAIIHFKLFPSPLIADYDLSSWVAVSSNLVFLSLIMAILIGNTIRSFETVISKELMANNALQTELVAGAHTSKLLTESESQFKSLFFQNPSPMWVLDKESLLFLLVNDAAVHQYGYTSEEFLCMSIKDIKLADDVQNMHENLEKNEVTGLPLSFLTEHVKKNGEKFYAEVTFNSISFQGKAATLAISQDITEQVNYIQEVERQNKKLQDIAWIQSHKVRGPLATILGLAQLFNHKEIEVDTEEIVQGILQTSIKLDTVIREIVDKTSNDSFQVMPNKYNTKGL